MNLVAFICGYAVFYMRCQFQIRTDFLSLVTKKWFHAGLSCTTDLVAILFCIYDCMATQALHALHASFLAAVFPWTILGRLSLVGRN